MKKNDFQIILKYRLPIMGLAALWIFLFHEQEHEWVKVFFAPEWLSRVLYFIKRIGFCGVDIFLLLSGIGLVYSREKHSISSFYMRRLKRVFVPFFIIAVIRMLLENWSTAGFLKRVFLYDFLFVDVNSFLWFIPAIIILYLIFPLFYEFFKKARNKFSFAFFTLVVWLIFALLGKDILRGDLYAFINRIPIFVTGIFLAWYVREREFKFSKFTWLLFVLIFIVGIILAYLTNYRDLYLLVPISNCCIPTYMLALSSTVLIAAFLSLADRIFVGKWIIKAFSFIGKMSLEIYIVQEWLDDIIRPMMCSSYDNWMANFMKINLTIALAVFFAALVLHYVSSFAGKLIFEREKHN